MIATYTDEKDHSGALFFDLEKRTNTRLNTPGSFDVDDIYWLGNNHVMWSRSREKLYADALLVAEFGFWDRAYPIERASAVHVIGIPVKTPMKPVVWIRRNAYEDGRDYGVAQLDATKTVDPTSSSLQTTKGDTTNDPINLYGTKASVAYRFRDHKLGQTLDYLVDKNGELAFAIAIVNGVEKLLVLHDKKWVPSPLDLDRYDVIDAGDRPDEILAVGPVQDGKPRAIMLVNAATGAPGETIHQDENYDPDVVAVKRHPGTRDIVGLKLHRKSLDTVWFDPEYRQIQAGLNKLFPGKIVSILGSDEGVRQLTLAVYSDRQPVVYHLLDLKKNELSTIAESAPWVAAEKMRPMQTLTYKTSDGMRIEGYLTLPAGASKETPAPMVVLAHGGPHARDTWEWNPEVQFLASRGYAVFQPNYRGSLGYAWRFPAGANWDFKRMHQDVTEGVQQIVKSGLIDPKRIAIMGASFGGYLALCGAAYEPDLYRCAISEAGVFDWTLMMQDAKRDRFENARYQIYLRNIGDPAKNAELFASVSPMNHVDRIKIPILIAHGREDQVASIAQSEKLAAELQRHGVPHEVLFKPGEGHGLFRLDNRVEYYTAVEAFLAHHLRRE